METIKELFSFAVEYCKTEPFHAAIIGGLAVFVMIIIGIIIGLSCKYSKAKKALKVQAETANPQPAVAPTPIEKTTVKEEPVGVKGENPPKKTMVKTEEKPIECVPAPIQEEEKAENVSLKKETKVIEAEPVQEETVVEKTEEKPAVQEKAEPKQKKVPAQKSGTAETEKITAKQESKENKMLLDELKDSDMELHFYEEDETDKVARYSGKWVICRVVTDDNDSEEMYFFELHASNGEKLLSSEEYTTYNGAIRGIETHKSNILRNNFRITLSKRGDYIFKLLNGKGMLLCMGEHYATRARCESAIESAKRFARTAFVDENIQDQVVKMPPEDETPIEPLAEGYNGKWVIDCNTSPEGEKVFYFELFANNGERLLSSEEYTTYIGAVNGIHTHKTNIQKGNFRISLTKHGDYIYKLLNGNGQLLCLGEHYKTKRRCQNAVESVKRFALNSPTLTDPELTK